MNKQLFWVDSNIYISAKNGIASFAVFPKFWGFLDAQLTGGRLRSPRMVYQEIVNNEGPKDDLCVWFKTRRDKGLNVTPSKDVQLAYKDVVNHVANCGRWDPPDVIEFLRGADPWLVAHAMSEGGFIVTLETDTKPEAKKVRIPDVANHFHVKCVALPHMLVALGAKFS